MAKVMDVLDHETVDQCRRAAGLLPWLVLTGETGHGGKIVAWMGEQPTLHDLISLRGDFFRVKSRTFHREPEGLTIVCRDAGLHEVARLVLL